jgi:uncharacterized protein
MSRRDHVEGTWVTGSPRRSRYGRRLRPAGDALVVMVVMLFTWTLLYAPTLRRAAEASPVGVRRTVSLAVLTPFAAISDLLGLDAVARTLQRAVGRREGAPGGAFVPPPDDLPIAPPDDDPAAADGDQVDEPSEEGDPIRIPTPTRRLRVVVVGDSLAAGLGYFAERVFKPKFVRVSRQGRISTGLARPDYFNWPFAMRRIVQAFDPDLVIVMLGENDHQPIQTVRGEREAATGTPAWPVEYRERVLALMRIATSRGAKLVWAGLPVSSDRGLRQHSKRQNEVFEEAAEAMPNVAYFDAWSRFSERGRYTAYFREGRRYILVREQDGLHFNAIGYTIVAREIAELAAEEFGLAPRTFEVDV